MNANPLSAGRPVYDFYSIEVVQRIGYDSFTPDNGVLIAKNKSNEGNTCGYNCFTWVIDAHPEDIRMEDFKRPNGEPVMRTIADYRQLNDALFHAGLNSGSQYEWEDTPPALLRSRPAQGRARHPQLHGGCALVGWRRPRLARRCPRECPAVLRCDRHQHRHSRLRCLPALRDAGVGSIEQCPRRRECRRVPASPRVCARRRGYLESRLRERPDKVRRCHHDM